jgi:hypothetical protein
VKRAYKNGTRAMDGKPGKNYWQNHARYAITITAMPPDRTVKGAETISYINNSPDTLRNPSIKLFLNIHKAGAPREFGTNPDYLTSGVHVDECKVNGQTVQVRSDPFVFTNLSVKLPKPLLPHDSLQFSFDWHYEISLQSGREGMIDSTTYFLAYFYPRVAVYDDYNGWDRMPFMDSHEFYSDFNDYDVTINVPKNYIVVGTGTLQHPENLLQSAFLEKYNESFTSDQTIQIVTKQDWQAKNITTQNAVNSWRFRSINVPDVAFGISDHFNWDGCSVVVDEGTHRRAGAFAVYNDTAADYHRVAQYARHSLDWLSHHWPGIPYPYEKTTVFQGYAGMEYPMMANDESYEDTTFSRFVAEHEIAHTYMPFYMGINETKYAWMDEGWATIGEWLISPIIDSTIIDVYGVRAYSITAGNEMDLPIIIPSTEQNRGYYTNAYPKPAMGYLYIKDYLGDKLFTKAIHHYMEEWHGKHPLPNDFFYSMNEGSGKDLNWFWQKWFFDNGVPDLSISAVRRAVDKHTVIVTLKGNKPVPVDLTIFYKDGTKEKIHRSIAVWEKGKTSVTISFNVTQTVSKIVLGDPHTPDSNPKDNTWELK